MITAPPVSHQQAYAALVGAHIKRLQQVQQQLLTAPSAPSPWSWSVDANAASTAFRGLLAALKASSDAGDQLGICTYTIDGQESTAHITYFEWDSIPGKETFAADPQG
jgi:hypothetical protein